MDLDAASRIVDTAPRFARSKELAARTSRFLDARGCGMVLKVEDG
jgi:hypothetical protein